MVHASETPHADNSVTSQRPSTITLRFLASPSDVVMAGTSEVHIGRILEWVDKAAYACAASWSGSYCVTAYVGDIHLTRTIASGHIVEIRSRIAYTGRSSMHIINEVFSADPTRGVFTRACECLVIFIAVDDNKKPRPIPSYTPVTPEEKRAEKAVVCRMQLRKDSDREIAEYTHSGGTTMPEMTHRFLTQPTDVNWGGNVHGGKIMQWIDAAATACTMRWTGHYTMATHISGIRFSQPVRIGHLVDITARLAHTSEDTMTVIVTVRGCDLRNHQQETPVCVHAVMTYIAIDSQAKQLPIGQLTHHNDDDKRLAEHASRLNTLYHSYAEQPIVLTADNPNGRTTPVE